MSNMNDMAEQYLVELYRITNGDSTAQASMYDIGVNVGLDKEAAGKLAEDLIGQGFVEIRTLSGGIGITEQGIATATADDNTATSGFDCLGNSVVLEASGRETIERLLDAVKAAIGQIDTPYPQMETLVVDIKTIEIQLLSPQPKTAVIRAVLYSLQETLTTVNETALANQIAKIITD